MSLRFIFWLNHCIKVCCELWLKNPYQNFKFFILLIFIILKYCKSQIFFILILWSNEVLRVD